MKKEGLKNEIEAVLFYTSEPLSLSFLIKTLGVKKEEVVESLNELGEDLKIGGLRLLQSDEEYSLVTAPEHSELIEKLIKEERERDLGRAGMETLTIIAYKGPVSKKDIEYIRGVNSQYVLRNLLLRGLIERNVNKEDERQVVYTVTIETIKFLGLSKISDLPDYELTQKNLEVDNIEQTGESETDGN